MPCQNAGNVTDRVAGFGVSGIRVVIGRWTGPRFVAGFVRVRDRPDPGGPALVAAGALVPTAGASSVVAHLPEGAGFELADALAGQAEAVPDVLQRLAAAVAGEAEAVGDDFTLVVVKAAETPAQLLAVVLGL